MKINQFVLKLLVTFLSILLIFQIPFLHGSSNKWVDFFIPLDGIVIIPNDEIPKVEIKWKKIYAK